MCGIVGYIGFEQIDNYKVINKMTKSLSHRGPDNQSSWINSEDQIALGHTRLSIFDLSINGNQPMFSKNKRFIIVYNGEIYNFNELKIKYNIHCTSNSDTEVLLELISKIGLTQTLILLRGMFSFALYDTQEKILSLCRDRIGEKPLYYGWTNNTFIFASELKAFKQYPNFQNLICRDSLSLLVKYNYIPCPNSIYKDIYKLEPGKYLSITNKCRKINFYNNHPVNSENFILKDYWNLKDAILKSKNNQINNKEDAITEVEKNLAEVVKMQSLADVPVGAFLSGGIDSSLITSLMQSTNNNKINTFTIGSYDSQYNEAEYAKKIAKHLDTNHTELYINPDDAIDIIPDISNIYDEPFADSSQLPTTLISRLTKQYVKVSLSGDGGDELFGGYNRYLKAPKLWKLLRLTPYFIKNNSTSILNKISNTNYNKIEKVLNLFFSNNKKINFLSTKINRLSYRLNNVNSRNALYLSLITEWQNFNEVVINSKEPYHFMSEKNNLDFLDNFEQEMMYNDTLSYLPDDILTKVDRASMSVGLESRSPFLDHKIVELSWMINKNFKINNGIGKIVLRDILYKYVPKNLIERPKQGFGIPLASWIRGPLKDWANDLLNEKKLETEGYFNPKLIRARFESHLKGENNWEHSLWSILMFQSWNDNNK